MSGVVVAGGGVEHGAGRGARVGGIEFAACDSVSDDPGELPDEGVDVGSDDVSGLGGE